MIATRFHLSRPQSSSRPGMTLLETLAALFVLSLLIFGGGAWIISANRAAHAVTAASQETIVMVRALNAVRADLVEADPDSIILDGEDNAIRATTTRCAPGAPAGWRRIYWRLDDGSLIRFERTLPDTAETEARQTVLLGVESFTIAAVDNISEVDSGVRLFTIAIRLRSGMQMQRLWGLDQ